MGRVDTWTTVASVLRRLAPFPEATLLIGAWVLPIYRALLDLPAEGLITLDLDIAFDADDKRASWRTREQARLLVRMRNVLVDSGEFRIVALPPAESPREGAAHGLEANAEAVGLRIDLLAQKHQRRRAGSLRAPPLDRHFGVVGLVPQRLDRLSLLFREPWSGAVGSGFEVPIPNPLSFVLQKALIRSDRKVEAKRHNDAASILETALLFAEQPSRMAGIGSRLRYARRTRQSVDRAVRTLRGVFSDGPGLGHAIDAMRSADAKPSRSKAMDAVAKFLAVSGIG